MRKTIKAGLAAGAAMLLMPGAALAQDDMEQVESEELEGLDELTGLFGALFAPEPLTPEQEARLPLATSVVAKALPEGIMADMMSSMFDGLLGPIFELAGESSATQAATRAGLYGDNLDEESAAAAMAIIDPAWQERDRRIAEAMPQIMGEMMVALEPGLRKAMSEAYAIYFDEQELTDIGAFLSTDSGSAFARKSFQMSSDPRFLGVMMEGMPMVMASFTDMEEAVTEMTSDLAAPRDWDALSEAERARLVELTGTDAEALSASLDPAAGLDWSEDESEVEEWDGGDEGE